MCGIVGLCLQRRSVRVEDLESMNSTIVHRGPDGTGVHVDGTTGIGMRRLSIIDLHGGWQPIANENGRIHVVQNGEIYNFRELRKELEARGHVFRTESDTEAIVHAYEEWGGRNFANHLRGMFAIAIHDADRGELWLVRDRLGIKPLYLAETPAGFGFASEIKALLASPILAAKVNPRAVAQYLAFGSPGHGTSFLQDVQSLPPGYVACHKQGRTELTAYWEFRMQPQEGDWKYEDAREELRHRLHSAVKSHLVSDVPVGAFLSGGIDSSIIVGLMAKELGASFKTFSIGFHVDEFNELPHAKQIADQWRTDHHVEMVTPNAVDIVETLVRHFDEPFADPSAIPTWYVSQLAARHVKVVLSGDGGDELFAGYDRYTEANRDQWIDWIPPFLRTAISRCAQFMPDRTPGRYFLDYMQYDRGGRYAYQLDLFPRPLRQRLLRNSWHPNELEMIDPTHERAELLRGSGAPDLIGQCSYLDTKHYLPLDILTKVDRMTMAHSIESRPPLLDHELVEFASRLPTRWKVNAQGVQKHILKDSAKDLLPTNIVKRKKAGFAVPLQKWFATDLATMFGDTVMDNAMCHEYFDPQVIRELFSQNRTGRRDHGMKLWSILVFEIWLRSLRDRSLQAAAPFVVR